MEKERSGIKEVYLIFPNNRECRVEVLTPAGERRGIAAYNLAEDSEAVISVGHVLKLRVTLHENCPWVRKVACSVSVKLISRRERALFVVIDDKANVLLTNRPRDLASW